LSNNFNWYFPHT